jgi:hypothetical protein
MGKVPKKPNKRRSKKKVNSSNLKPLSSSEDGYQRFLQANAIRKQIKDNLGDIFSEISPFEISLSEWTSKGIDKHGTCEVSRLGKIMEWKLHSDVNKYPEVWFRDIE